MNQLTLLLAPLKSFLAKHHPVLFISLITLLLAAAVYTLYDVVANATAPVEDATSTIVKFDQKTIDKIKELHDSSDTVEKLDLPSPRSNPFVE